jgi:hypothetical protein
MPIRLFCGLYRVMQFQRCADVPKSFSGSTCSRDKNIPIATKNPGADALVNRDRLDLLHLAGSKLKCNTLTRLMCWHEQEVSAS